ncbi:MAG: hypothetical protein AAF447_07170 [Myxococcota bacterium]
MSGALVIAIAFLATLGGLALVQRGRKNLAALLATVSTLVVGGLLADQLHSLRESPARAEPARAPTPSLWTERPSWVAPGCEDIRDPALCSGLAVYHVRRCDTCHSLEAEGGALSFAGLWGRERELRSGETARVDRPYLLRSLLRPSYDVPAGYEGPPMPRFRLRAFELDALETLLTELADGALPVDAQGPEAPADAAHATAAP